MINLRVVLAEDHDRMREALGALLSTEFEIVGAAANGSDLVELALALHPDVIVSDIGMPKLSGPQAMQRLNESGLKIPFVFVTAHHEFMDPGSWSIVAKLDAADELVPAVHAVFEGHRYLSHFLRPRSDGTPGPVGRLQRLPASAVW